MTVASCSLDAFLDLNLTVGDTKIFINRAQKKSDDKSLTTRIYFMKDLFNPAPLMLSDLKSHLLTFGKVVDIHIFKNHLGVSKEYGFCDFEESGPISRLLELKCSEMKDGNKVYYQKNKSKIKKRVLVIQKKLKKNIIHNPNYKENGLVTSDYPSQSSKVKSGNAMTGLQRLSREGPSVSMVLYKDDRMESEVNLINPRNNPKLNS